MPDEADIVERLRAIEEELRDLAYDRLRAASEHRDEHALRDEKRVSRARRAVERAITALGGSPETDFDGP
jgi:hypothetical protein